MRAWAGVALVTAPGPGDRHRPATPAADRSRHDRARCAVGLAEDGRSEEHVTDHYPLSAWMEDSVFHQHMRQTARRVATLAFAGAAALGSGAARRGHRCRRRSARADADHRRLSVPPRQHDTAWPSRTASRSVGAASPRRRCRPPTTCPRCTRRNNGQGVTIAIIDSFGNPNMASDLANFNTQMGLPHMCGEPGLTCAAGMPTFQHVYWNGKTQVKAPPPKSMALASRRATSGPWRPPGRRVGALHRAGSQHHQRHHEPGRDAGRAGLPGDDERRAVHRGPPRGERHHPELRCRRGDLREAPSRC